MIDGYSLEDSVVGGDIDEYLVARWRGTGDYNETGLRPLTDWFNRNLLKATYADHDRTATAARVESEYDALTGDDEIRRGEVVDALSADGIDGRAVLSDFVSTSTLYRHFRDCLDEEKSSDAGKPDPDSDWERDKVAYVRRTIRQNAEEAVRSLDNKSRIPNASDADIEVPVLLSCPDCSTKVRFEVALDRGYVCRDHLGGGDGTGSGSTHPEDVGQSDGSSRSSRSLGRGGPTDR